MDRSMIAGCLVLALLGTAIVEAAFYRHRIDDHRYVDVGRYHVCVQPKTAPDPAPDSTFETLKANPDVISISFDEPNPNGGPDDVLGTDWYRYERQDCGYIHKRVPRKRGQ